MLEKLRKSYLVELTSRPGLRGKIILGLGAILLFSFGAVVGAAYWHGTHHEEQEAFYTMQNKLELDSSLIYDELLHSTENLQTILGSSPAQEILRLSENGGTHPAGAGYVAVLKARLEHTAVA